MRASLQRVSRSNTSNAASLYPSGLSTMAWGHFSSLRLLVDGFCLAPQDEARLRVISVPDGRLWHYSALSVDIRPWVRTSEPWNWRSWDKVVCCDADAHSSRLDKTGIVVLSVGVRACTRPSTTEGLKASRCSAGDQESRLSQGYPSRVTESAIHRFGRCGDGELMAVHTHSPVPGRARPRERKPGGDSFKLCFSPRVSRGTTIRYEQHVFGHCHPFASRTAAKARWRQSFRNFCWHSIPDTGKLMALPFTRHDGT